MTILHVFLLSVLQGVTEFLPVSSSAHLVLYNQFVIGIHNSLSLDIAMHIGSLLAVILLIAKPLKENTSPILEKNGFNKSIFLMILATIPLIFMALVLEYLYIIDLARNLEIIAFFNILFALLLFASDRKIGRRKLSDITKKDALIIGIWQSFAIFPGTSRSGASITGARFLSFDRKDAIIISVILSIPSIALSSAYIVFKFVNSASGEIETEFMIYGILFSFIISFFTLKLFVRLGESFSFTPFVIYRIFLGLVILSVLYINSY